MTDGNVRRAEPSRVRRVQALLCTAPVHELQASRAQRGGLWSDLDCYDLVLEAIDMVVDRMGFDVGCSQADLEAHLSQTIALLYPQAQATAADDVANTIVEILIRPRRAAYTDDRRRPFDFALLREHPGVDGAYLVATNEAINVLVGALDTDVASAQAAAEAQLHNLLRRNRLAEAAAVARDARIRSIQYGAEVKRLIVETKRDVRRAGWSGDVPKRLREILEHLDERLELEQRMLSSLRERRDDAEREDLSLQATELIEVVTDCMNRHRDLHNLVLEAEQAFYVEQHRQAFLPGVHLRGVDLIDELLGPVLAAPFGTVADVVTTFARAACGVRTPRLARLDGLLSMLLSDGKDVMRDGAALPDHSLDDPADDPRRFSTAAWEAANATLEQAVAAPRRLSDLLRLARQRGVTGADDLVALRSLSAFDPALGRPRAGDIVFAAADDGSVLADPDWQGSDLLVGAVTVDGIRLATRRLHENDRDGET